MSGNATAGAAAVPGVESGKYDRARMSKVHDELWEKSDAAKIVIDTASRRAKDLSASQLTRLLKVVHNFLHELRVVSKKLCMRAPAMPPSVARRRHRRRRS